MNEYPYAPQSQGLMCAINSSNEISTIPIYSSICAAVCFAESIIFLKTNTNGIPSFVPYKFAPLEKVTLNMEELQKQVGDLTQKLKEIEQRLPIKKEGGKINELLQ